MTDDTSRPAATDNDKHTLTIEQVADRYADAGHARTIRTLQRYCVGGHLDCLKLPTKLGDKYVVTPESVDRHLAQLDEFAATQDATSRGQSRQVATIVAEETKSASRGNREPTDGDQARPVATEARYLGQLESENSFLRTQLSVKDEQIKDLTERARETNHLIAGLQKMLTPLLGRSSEAHPEAHARSDTPREAQTDHVPAQ
jgi:hypothetical protein